MTFIKEQKSFNSEGVKISYTKEYINDSGKKPIIFVHGNGESGGIFDKISRLFSREYTVYCPDSRSHGKSDKVKRLHYVDIADDIANLIKHENMTKPIFFGFSDGGIVGLLIAIKYPELIDRLFVAGINLTPKGCKRWLRILQAVVFFFLRSDKLRLMMKEPNITPDDLKGLKIPTTVFYGEKDIVELSDSKTVAENVKGCELVILKNEGHASYVLNNDKLYELLYKRISK